MWATAVSPDRQGGGLAGQPPPVPESAHVRTFTRAQPSPRPAGVSTRTRGRSDGASRRRRTSCLAPGVCPLTRHVAPWLTWPPTASRVHPAQGPSGRLGKGRADLVAHRFPETNQTPTKTSIITRHPKLASTRSLPCNFHLGEKAEHRVPATSVCRLMTSPLTSPNDYFSQRNSTRGQLRSLIFSHCS